MNFLFVTFASFQFTLKKVGGKRCFAENIIDADYTGWNDKIVALEKT